MKTEEIVRGETYLFARTNVEHRRDMVGQLVTVSGIQKGGNKAANQLGGGKNKKPARIRLTNGRFANPAELQQVDKPIL